MEADRWRLSVLFWSHQTSITFCRPKGVHRPSIHGAWSCRKRERGRENKHSLKKLLHEFPKNLKGKYCKLAGGPQEACGQWIWLGSVSQPTLSSLLVAFIQQSRKTTSLHASPSPTVSFINFMTLELPRHCGNVLLPMGCFCGITCLHHSIT